MIPMSTLFRLLVLVGLCCLMRASVIAQIAPGGVNPNNGLVLWLRAGDLNPANRNITTDDWPSVVNSPTNDAIYRTNNYYEVSERINFNFVARLNDEYFTSPINIATSDLNVFMMYRLDSQDEPLWGNRDNGSNNNRRMYSHRVYRGGGNNSNQTYPDGNTTGEVYINHNSVEENANGGSYVYINGDEKIDYTSTGTAGAGTNFAIGREGANTSPQRLDARVGEVIVYTEALSPLEREKVTSYLAIKYGVTLPHPYYLSSGSAIWTTPTSYGNNIAGIANDVAAGLSQPRSKSQESGAILEVLSVNAMNNGDALMWGHNSERTDQIADFQDENNFFARGRRMRKVWKFIKTGTVDGFNISIDKPLTLPGASYPDEEMYMVIADDAAFTQNVRFHPVTDGPNSYDATGVQFGAQGDYFVSYAWTNGALWMKADGNLATIGNAPILVDQAQDAIFGINNLTSPPVAAQKPILHNSAANPSTDFNFNPYM